MPTTIPTQQPFSFPQALAFIRRFPACQHDTIVDDASVTAALAVDGRGHAFTVREHGDAVVLDTEPGTPARVRSELARSAAAFLGANDDLAPFYAAARGDAPIQRAIAALHGLH